MSTEAMKRAATAYAPNYTYSSTYLLVGFPCFNVHNFHFQTLTIVLGRQEVSQAGVGSEGMQQGMVEGHAIPEVTVHPARLTTAPAVTLDTHTHIQVKVIKGHKI